jgi:Skp family chaperone for outer membrane proteins
MKHPFLALAIVAIASLTLPTFAQNTPKIAVANPDAILANIQERKDMQSRFDQDRKTIENIALGKQQKIKDVSSRRDALKSDSPQWTQLNKELIETQVDFEVWGRIIQADLQRRFKQELRQLYDKVTAGVAELAAEKKIDLVTAEIVPDIPDNLDQVNPDQLRALMMRRNVLFVTSQLDITQAVIASMDAKYTKK